LQDSQLRLFDPLAPNKLMARTVPVRMWVRRLVVWRDLAAEPIRNIRLERGLNIIWSPSGESPDDDRLPRGHAAGKSMFCRMLRYVLGEPSFADDEDESRIRFLFHAGVVGAEVMIDGVAWCVRRPFKDRAKSQAWRGNDVFHPPDERSGSWEAYLDALQGTLGDAERVANYPDPTPGSPWLYALAWLTRDQECRVEGIASWRHKESDSGSPVRGTSVSAADRLTVMRVALGLYDTEARRRADLIATLTKAAAKAGEKASALERRAEGLLQGLATALEVPAEELLPQEWGEPDIAEHKQALRKRVAARIQSCQPPKTTSLPDPDEARLTSLAGELAQVEEVYRAALADVEKLERLVALKSVDVDGASKLHRDAKHPVCPLQTIDPRCALPHLPDAEAAWRAEEEEKRQLKEAEGELSDARGALKNAAGRRASLKRTVEGLERKVNARRSAEDTARAAQNEALQRAFGAQGLVNAWAEAAVEWRRALEAVEETEKQRDQARAEENQSRGEQDVGRLEHLFDQLVRRVLDPDATGSIGLGGHGLRVEINRRSVALSSLRVVLFDLAAMLLAAEGAAWLPAFLVHDSPREGDLDGSTYNRIFRAVHELAGGVESAPFQYIITTTSAPPVGVIRDTLVRETLASTPAERRFLKENL